LNKEKRTKIFQRFRSANPTPTTELNFSSSFELLIAVVLSAQATDVSVNKAIGPLFKVANTPEAILDLGLGKLKKSIRTIGLYNTKASNIMKTCKILTDQYGSQVPEDRESLESLPGVGRKTANVILNTAFGQATMAVDTHIFRVSNRTGIAPGKNVLVVEKGLLKFIPDEFLKDAHHWLILHGRYTCMARNPQCQDCAIVDLCEWREKKRHS
jgi:endonuclease-3